MTLTEEIYAAGYAMPEYEISSKYSFWRFRDQHYKVSDNITRHFINGWPCGVAKIEDVKRMAIK